ncbi:50S ribosomal protein L11 methyltransferase [Desulfovirgula thermocuniculi]|uniref:50S ribosomal protein L11 methyltransferase n=1 Tax=Desulfovirgula thermocuniculi TaxID=348842 RepID=UPI000424A53F|nr:50S ribosomal protein L11 methyltransferase [Desulfovirgula thermocuniculi]
MRWLEVAVAVPREHLEEVGTLFAELGTGGVTIEDPALFSKYLDGPGDCVALDPRAVPAAPRVKGYFPAGEGVGARLAELKRRLDSFLGGAPYQLLVREVEEEDWAGAWKAYYRPLAVGKRLVVKPSWEKYRPLPGQVVVELDPGMAFGCGTHPTTRLSLAVLEGLLRGGETVVDVGTGSGILAIAAALLGARRVLAVDNDPVAVAVARENVERNRVQDVVEVREGDLLAGIAGPLDVVVANITAGAVVRLAPAAAGVLRPGGFFLASGIIREREEEVRRALEGLPLSLAGSRLLNSWVTLIARRE